MELNIIHNEDSLIGLKKLPDNSVHCCVTSPPYYGLRDYGVEEQVGMEATPELYFYKMMEIFDEVRRVLKSDGTFWLNLGDSYWGSGKAGNNSEYQKRHKEFGKSSDENRRFGMTTTYKHQVIKPKDLIGIPWMMAFALRNAGWYLISDIIWAKKNCMPESVTDRPTRSHEYIFLLSKSAKYYYDHEAIKEPAIYDIDGTGTAARKARQHNGNKSEPTELTAGIRASGFKDATKMNGKHSDKQRGHSRTHAGFNEIWDQMTKKQQCTGMRNKRDVWFISPAQFPEAHFATFPELLIVDCIKAGCPEGGIVLDPFMGAGTTALVARKLNRNYIGIELNPKYVDIANKRLKKELGIFQ